MEVTSFADKSRIFCIQEKQIKVILTQGYGVSSQLRIQMQVENDMYEIDRITCEIRHGDITTMTL